MITEIGIAAGDIWHYLDHNGEATLEALVKGTGKKRDLLLMSLGWLAREGHINLQEKGNTYSATLNSAR